MTMNQELRQAAAQAKEALTRLSTQMKTLLLAMDVPQRFAASFNDGQKEADAALSALSAVLEKQDSSHLAACDSEARSGSGVPARPTLPGEDERARFEAWWNDDTSIPKAPDGYSLYQSHALAAWKARAALAASPLPQEGRWMPIESAPKDGREVLLMVKLRAGIPRGALVGHFMQGGHCIEDHPAIDQGWYFWNGCMFDKAAAPTHWMPLPAAPGTQGEQKP